MTERYSYDVFGEATIRDSCDVPRDSSAYGNAYMFTGREFDSETGLYYYRARYYLPRIGRFMSADPLGTVPDGMFGNLFDPTMQYEDGMNAYTYVRNNPVMKTDPMGLAFYRGRRCPSHLSGVISNRSLCYDYLNLHPAHWGQMCYREVVPRGRRNTRGLHCCYRGSNLVDRHIDSVDPAEGGGGGLCRYNWRRTCEHFNKDVL